MSGFGGDIIGGRSRLESAIYVANEAARLALSPKKDGQLVLQVDTNTLYSWDEGGSTYTEVGGALTPASVSDTNTVDHTVTTGVLSSDVSYQDSNSVNLSDDASGLKADVVTQNTNSVNISEDASGVKADLNIQDTNTVDLSVDGSGLKGDLKYQDSNSVDLSDDASGLKADILTQNSSTVDLSVDASGLKADVLPAGVDHDSLLNTHDLTTDINHNTITNNHNLTSDIDHDQLTNYAANEHFTEASIDHVNIQNKGTNTHGEIDTAVSNSVNHIASTLNPHSTTKDQVLSGDLIDNDDVDASAAIVESKLSLDYSTSSLNSAVNSKQADVITTRGDVVIGDSSGDAERLAIGNADQVLASDGTDVSWIDAAGGSEIKETESTHGFSVLDPIYHDGSNWVLAKADVAATVATHIIKEVVDVNTFKALQFGRVESTAHGLTIGDYHWLSTATAGSTVTTEPTSGYSCPLFYILDANNIIALVYRPNAIGDGVASDSEIGSIIAFAGTSTPTGFLACEGQAISRSSYSKLFSAIGTTWGVGDGSTTFNLPDGRSGFLVGAGEGDEFTVNTDRSVGDYDDDQMQGHRHYSAQATSSGGGTTYFPPSNGTLNTTTKEGNIRDASTDGTNGTPRTGDETKPNSLAVKFCIRYEPKAALQGIYTPEIVYLKDIKSSGTAGGTFTSGSWQTRTLNTTENSQTWCSLSTNQFTLQPGKYKVRASADGYQVLGHKIIVYNISDSSNELLGSNSFSGSSDTTSTLSLVSGKVDISSAKTFEIQHRCSNSKSSNGLGVALSFSVSEIYTQVEIERIGD